MSTKSLYQKYRPSSFSEIIGQHHIVKILTNAIKQNKHTNSYVFSGSKGTGKTSIARIFAGALNCKNFKNDICKTCDVCQSIVNNSAIDIIELDAASNNGVDDIRRINESINFLPTMFSKKVYIIDEAHMLTNGAWNALLKTLESPLDHVVFIFATTEIEKIPATIISRCQCFQFYKITNQDIWKQLVNVCKKENIKYTEEALKLIAKLSSGGLRDALSILQQVATYSNDNVNEKAISEIYGLLSCEETIEIINNISNKSIDKIISISNKLSERSINLTKLTENIILIYTDLLIFNKTNNYDLLFTLNKDELNKINKIETNKINELLFIWNNALAKMWKISEQELLFIQFCLQSINIFEGNRVVEKIKENNINFKNESKEIKDELPSTKNIFKYEEIIIDKPVEKKESKLSSLESPKKTNLKLRDYIPSFFAHKNNNLINEYAKLIEKMNSDNELDSSLILMQNAQKIILAGENFIVLLFNNEIDAKIFNKLFETKSIMSNVKKYFNKAIFIFATTTRELDSYKNACLEAKQNPKNAKLPPISMIEDFIKIEHKASKIALDFFKD